MWAIQKKKTEKVLFFSFLRVSHKQNSLSKSCVATFPSEWIKLNMNFFFVLHNMSQSSLSLQGHIKSGFLRAWCTVKTHLQQTKVLPKGNYKSDLIRALYPVLLSDNLFRRWSSVKTMIVFHSIRQSFNSNIDWACYEDCYYIKSIKCGIFSNTKHRAETQDDRKMHSVEKPCNVYVVWCLAAVHCNSSNNEFILNCICL